MQPRAVAGRQRRVGQHHRPAVGDRDPRVPPPAPGVVGRERPAVDPLHHRRRPPPAAGRQQPARARCHRRERRRPARSSVPGSSRRRRRGAAAAAAAWSVAPASRRTGVGGAVDRPSAARRRTGRPDRAQARCRRRPRARRRRPRPVPGSTASTAPRPCRSPADEQHGRESGDHAHSAGCRSPSSTVDAARRYAAIDDDHQRGNRGARRRPPLVHERHRTRRPGTSTGRRNCVPVLVGSSTRRSPAGDVDDRDRHRVAGRAAAPDPPGDGQRSRRRR